MNNKLIRIGGAVLIGAIIIGGAYFLFQRVMRDRDAAMAYRERPVRRVDTPTPPTRTVKTYNSKDLEDARKKGTLPADTKNAPAPTNATNDAVQRNLRTLEEINRINQMNQRLMEQQERMRRQNKN